MVAILLSVVIALAIIWALAYHDNEISDFYRNGANTRIGIDAYINGESVSNADVVTWYGAHFRHSSDDDPEASHLIGPTIRPVTR